MTWWRRFAAVTAVVVVLIAAALWLRPRLSSVAWLAPPEGDVPMRTVPSLQRGKEIKLPDGAEMPGGLTDICVTAREEVFVTSAQTGEILALSGDGELLFRAEPPVEGWRPIRIVAGHDGALYVADNRSIRRFSSVEQEWKPEFVVTLRGRSSLKDMAVAADGTIVILDPTLPGFHVVDEGGSITKTIEAPSLKSPSSIALSSDGRIICGDGVGVSVLDADGRQLSRFEQENRFALGKPGPDVEIDTGSFFFVSHPDVHAIEIFDPSGDRISRWSYTVNGFNGLHSINAITLHEPDALYVVHAGRYIYRFRITDRSEPDPAYLASLRPRGPNIVLVTLDTTRPDRLGFGGHEYDTSPNLDRIADAGMVFPNAVSSSSDTAAAHATMLTSLQPFTHQLRNLTDRLDPRHVSVAELLRNRGYRTASFTSGFPLVPKYGLDQGFELYDPFNAVHDGARTVTDDGTRTAEDTNRQVLPWLKRMVGQKIFLWVHYYDPHTPYEPPPDHADRFPHCASGRSRQKIHAVGKQRPVEVCRLLELYDGEISYMDEQFGALVDGLRRLGFADELFMIVAADHGEILYEYPRLAFNHGHSLKEEEFRIPLVMRDTTGRRIRRPGESPWPAQLIDVAPTVLDVAGLNAPPTFQGVSLLDTIDGSTTRPLTVSMNLRMGPELALGHYFLRMEDWKIGLHARKRDTWMIRLSGRDPIDESTRIQGIPQLPPGMCQPAGGDPQEEFRNCVRGLVAARSPIAAELFDLPDNPDDTVAQQLTDIYSRLAGCATAEVYDDLRFLEGAPMSGRTIDALRALGYVD